MGRNSRKDVGPVLSGESSGTLEGNRREMLDLLWRQLIVIRRYVSTCSKENSSTVERGQELGTSVGSWSGWWGRAAIHNSPPTHTHTYTHEVRKLFLGKLPALPSTRYNDEVSHHPVFFSFREQTTFTSFI